MNIDTTNFGTNLFRSKMTQSGSGLSISQRGGLFALGFVFVAGIPVVIIVKEHIEFSGWSILWYVAVALFLFIGLLYAVYVQVISFDFVSRKFLIRRGFYGFVRVTEAPFSDIIEVVVTEKRMTSHRTEENPRIETFATWDIGIECENKTTQPQFAFWNSASKESALHIANTLAGEFGTNVRIERST